MWLEDAPDTSDMDTIEPDELVSITAYFDALVSATIGRIQSIAPSENPCRFRYSDLTAEQHQSDLDRLLSAVQRHSRCGEHCLRRRRGSRILECRYNFPIPCEPESVMRKVDGDWRLVPKRNNQLLQRHNKLSLKPGEEISIFRLLVTKDAFLRYIAKYASKSEYSSPAFSQVLQQIIQRNRVETPAATLVKQLISSSVAERNYSAQEVMHLIVGYPLYHASRLFNVLSLIDDWRRFGENGVNRTLVQYANRPVMVGNCNMDELSLYEYFKRFQTVRDDT